MTKKNGGPALTPLTVTGTPTALPDGSEVECDIAVAAPGYETDNALFLPGTTEYDITFELKSSAFGTYTFDQKKPFCNRKRHCPKPLPGGAVGSPYKVTEDGCHTQYKSITVNLAKVGSGRAVTHYRLNFDGGYSFDPIIIHE